MSAPTAQETAGHQQSGATAARDPSWTDEATKDQVTDAAVGKAGTKLDDVGTTTGPEWAAYQLSQGADKLKDNVMSTATYVNESAMDATTQAIDAAKSYVGFGASDGGRNSLNEPGDASADFQHQASAASQSARDTVSDLTDRAQNAASQGAEQLKQAAGISPSRNEQTFVPSGAEDKKTPGADAYEYARETLNYAARAAQDTATKAAEYARSSAGTGNKAAAEESAATQDAMQQLRDAASEGAAKVQDMYDANKSKQGDVMRDTR